MIKKFEEFVNEGYIYTFNEKSLKKYISDLDNDERLLLQKLKPHKDEIGKTLAWVVTSILCENNTEEDICDYFDMHYDLDDYLTRVSGPIELGGEEYIIDIHFNGSKGEYSFTSIVNKDSVEISELDKILGIEIYKDKDKYGKFRYMYK